ncbi:THO complex subunit 1 transcription elongation factor-domain-containing protein [Gongronella butleri]|nr:THO complex subunit 1 transcription elongation factor-domain-containing protein [Gongronella butleri]
MLSAAEALVADELLPMCGPDTKALYGIMEGKPDWRRTALEHVVRRQFLDIVTQHPETDPERFTLIFDMLDITVIIEAKGFVDATIPFMFVEELLDIHSIEGCARVFEFVETRRDRLMIGMVPSRGKSLILLRLCNELLRRLSTETGTVLCGRVLFLLAKSFPLSERSGVNLRGDFNTEPVIYEDDETIDNDPDMTDSHKEFYKTFWGTRKYFSNPPSLLNDDAFEDLQNRTKIIMEKFQRIADKDQQVAGVKSSTLESIKRKNMDDELPEKHDLDVKELLQEINDAYVFPRLLTSRHLLELEMRDMRVRRSVLLQYMILFQYLRAFSDDERERTKELLALRQAKAVLVMPSYVVTDDQIRWIDETEAEMVILMKRTKPHGTMFSELASFVLKHERSWNIWKLSGCPALEKKGPFDTKMLQEGRQELIKRLKIGPGVYRYQYGNSEMTNMYTKPKATLSSLMEDLARLPEPVRIIDKALEHVNSETDADINVRFNIANGALFHASRIAFRIRASLIPKIYEIKHKVASGDQSAAPSSSSDDDDDMDECTMRRRVVKQEKRKKKRTYPLLWLLFLCRRSDAFGNDASSKTILAVNHCSYALDVGYQTNGSPSSEMHAVPPGQTHTITVDAKWAGRVWGRAVAGNGTSTAGAGNPASLAEFTMTADYGQDFYDISFVDGFNLPMAVAPANRHQQPPQKRHCEPVECRQLPSCPDELIHAQKKIAATASNGPVAIETTCLSACSRYGSDNFCCVGQFGSPEKCNTNHYAQAVKNVCQDVYTFPFDDETSVFACSDSAYTVTFCP